MDDFVLSQMQFATIVGAAVLAGCASDAVLRQAQRQAQDDTRRAPTAGVARSWMSPDSRPHDRLFYVSDSSTYDVYVFSGTRLVGTLTDQNNPAGLCVDGKQHVYVTQLYGHQIVEYAHGGTKPIKILSDPGYEPGACSVGPEGLAVANVVSDEFTQGNLVVYPNATGTPITYSPPGGSSGWFSVNAVGYDPAGNAYFAGTCNSAFCAGVLPQGAANRKRHAEREPQKPRHSAVERHLRADDLRRSERRDTLQLQV